jgi:hypothetical protein
MESVIAAALTIEGKIEGSGHVRLVGKFKGDVHVDGDLTIEPGAKVAGSVRAGTVVIGGELEGNIESATTVKLSRVFGPKVVAIATSEASRPRRESLLHPCVSGTPRSRTSPRSSIR